MNLDFCQKNCALNRDVDLNGWVFKREITVVLSKTVRASPMTLHLHLHLHFLIRNADADARYWPSHHAITQIGCKLIQEAHNSLHFVEICRELTIS